MDQQMMKKDTLLRISEYVSHQTETATIKIHIDDLLHSCTYKTANVIDALAPEKVKLVSNKQKAPWRNNHSVRVKKRECQKAE